MSAQVKQPSAFTSTYYAFCYPKSSHCKQVVLLVSCQHHHLKPKLTLHRPHNKPPLLFAHKLTHIIRPPRTIRRQVIHIVRHRIQLLGALVERARRPRAPPFVGLLRRTRGVRGVCRGGRGLRGARGAAGLFGFGAGLGELAFGGGAVGAADCEGVRGCAG
jgi:hypothetical protein